MRSNSPIEATHCKIHPACAWAGTSDWINNVDLFRINTTAIYIAAKCPNMFAEALYGSCATVIACWSTIQ